MEEEAEQERLGTGAADWARQCDRHQRTSGVGRYSTKSSSSTHPGVALCYWCYCSSRKTPECRYLPVVARRLLGPGAAVFAPDSPQRWMFELTQSLSWNLKYSTHHTGGL